MSSAEYNRQSQTSASRTRPFPTTSRQRSRVTNGRALLPDTDGRSPWSRRMRDLIALHVSDMGGESELSEAQRSMVRRAAVLTIELEKMEVRFATDDGDVKLIEAYQRTTNTLRRLLETIGIKRVPRDITPTLRDYIADDDGARR